MAEVRSEQERSKAGAKQDGEGAGLEGKSRAGQGRSTRVEARAGQEREQGRRWTGARAGQKQERGRNRSRVGEG